jgi:SAM-dependent methyltransferase
MKKMLTQYIKKQLPSQWRRWLLDRTRYPAVGDVDFGQFRHLQPVSKEWGSDRGTPIDRYYIERFLEEHQQDINGRVLEIEDDFYTRRFGQQASKSDVLHVESDNPKATIVADLMAAPQIGDGLFDAIICTQTLQFIPDVPAALQTLHRILKPGGVLLLTVPVMSQLEIQEGITWDDYWRFTAAGMGWLLKPLFGKGGCEITAVGNVLAATAFLQGLAVSELTREELGVVDPRYELLVTVRAVKE